MKKKRMLALFVAVVMAMNNVFGVFAFDIGQGGEGYISAQVQGVTPAAITTPAAISTPPAIYVPPIEIAPLQEIGAFNLVTHPQLPVNPPPALTRGGTLLAPTLAEIPEEWSIIEVVAISTEAELRAILDRPFNGTSRVYFYLTNDIHLTAPWVPIPLFGGVFNGMGHSIYNIFFCPDYSFTIGSGSTLPNYTFGLFSSTIGMVANVAVLNLGLHFTNDRIDMPNASNSAITKTVGGVIASAGPFTNLLIHNVAVVGDLFVTNTDGPSGSLVAGGLVGDIGTTGLGLLDIRDSYFDGSISAIGGRGITIAGGLVGRSRGHVAIENSYSLGNVAAFNVSEAIAGTRETVAGGLIGVVAATGTNNIVQQRVSISNSYVHGNLYAHLLNPDTTSATWLRIDAVGDLIGFMTSPNHNPLTISHSFHNSAQGRLAFTHPNNVLVLGLPIGDGPNGMVALRSRITVNLPPFTWAPNQEISGRVTSEANIQSVRLYCCGVFVRTIPVDANGYFSTRHILANMGIHEVVVTANVHGLTIRAVGQTDFRSVGTGAPTVESFRVIGALSGVMSQEMNTWDIPGQRWATLIYQPNQAFTYNLLLAVPAGSRVTEVNMLMKLPDGSTAATFAMRPTSPDNDRWVFLDRPAVLENYLSGRLVIEMFWHHETTTSVNDIVAQQVGVAVEQSRFRDSQLFPNSVVSPAVTTQAYVLRPRDEPNSGTINSNSGTHTFANGQMILETFGGNQHWFVTFTPEAVGRTFVFWAHSNTAAEVIIATVNEPGRFPVGNARGTNGFYFYGVVDGEEAVTLREEREIRYRIIIDPSGYVYEGVLSNRLAGVTATIFRQGSNTPWNAAEYDQVNPQITGQDGHYAWDVPPGNWRVHFAKEGFESVDTIYMPVPPEHLEVHVGLISRRVPTVQRVSAFPTAIEVVFDKFMYAEYLTPNHFTLTQNGVPIAGTLQLVNKESNFLGKDYLHGFIQASGFPSARVNPRNFATIVRFVPAHPISGEVEFTIYNTVRCYANVRLAANVTRTLTVVPEPKTISAAPLRLAFGESGTISVQVGPSNAVAGRRVFATNDNPYTVTTQEYAVVNANGVATFNVVGDLPGTANITMQLEDSTLSTIAGVMVAMPMDIRLAMVLEMNDPQLLAEVMEDLGVTPTTSPVFTSPAQFTGIAGIFNHTNVMAKGYPMPTFALTNAPAGVTINPTSGELQFAGAIPAGTHHFTIVASNGVQSANQLFTLTLNTLYFPNGGGGGGGNNDSGNQNNNVSPGDDNEESTSEPETSPAPTEATYVETVITINDVELIVHIMGDRAKLQLTYEEAYALVTYPTYNNVLTFDLADEIFDDVTQIQLPYTLWEALAETPLGLVIILPAGTIVLDEDAVNALALLAEEADILFSITEDALLITLLDEHATDINGVLYITIQLPYFLLTLAPLQEDAYTYYERLIHVPSILVLNTQAGIGGVSQPLATIGERVFISLRAFVYTLMQHAPYDEGFVHWDSATASATLTLQTPSNREWITLSNIRANESTLQVNGVTTQLDEPPTVIDGRFMLPLDVIGRLIGYDIATAGDEIIVAW
ncbi:MAG: stalk domain-containing protein [Defluviitaleaceae bacterium]|nr:stalk domain-containing protein [Defluviitaleaceae bacterium]MCL2273476.1 stalk domain-containing protein [Defluviitaleaceae bacterium]